VRRETKIAERLSSLHVSRLTFHEEKAHVAQLVEHVLGKDEVTRSIRVVGSKKSLLDPLGSFKGA
jgi:hypothetical protein